MAFDPALWKRLYNLFDPTMRLEMADQDLYVRRPGAVARSIADDLRLQLEPQGKWVVCGSLGCGKSSELVHLATLLDNTHTVIGLDLPGSVARVDLIQPAEVLFLIGAAAVRTAEDHLGHKVEEKLRSGLLNAFKGVLSSEGHSVDLGKLFQGVALFAANVAMPGAREVAGAATGVASAATGALGERARVTKRHSAKLGGLTRRVKEGEPDFERLREAVDNILFDLSQLRPPVVLVDGLDKLQALETIRDLFASQRILALPHTQIVYTGPITLMLATEWQAAGGAFKRERLTNLVVHQPDLEWVQLSDDTVHGGHDAMANIVGRRLRRLDLGPDDVFEVGCLEPLIEASGGLVRDLVHLVNRAIRRALRHEESSIRAETVDAAISEIRKEYEVTLNTRRVEELRHVREQGEPSGAEEAHDLLLGGYVLPYSNGRVWFEPHPILRGLRPGL